MFSVRGNISWVEMGLYRSYGMLVGLIVKGCVNKRKLEKRHTVPVVCWDSAVSWLLPTNPAYCENFNSWTPRYCMVWILTGMSSDMFLQISRCLKSFVALRIRARIGFFSGMCSCMTFQTISSSECLATVLIITFVRFFSAVRSLVHLSKRNKWIGIRLQSI